MAEQEIIDARGEALDEEAADQEMLQQPIPADRPEPDLAASVEKLRRKISGKRFVRRR